MQILLYKYGPKLTQLERIIHATLKTIHATPHLFYFIFIPDEIQRISGTLTKFLVELNFW